MIASVRRGWWRVAAEVLVVLAITVVASWVFGRAQAKQAGDEANWVGTARYFLVLFVRHDISAESWPDSYWTRTQPMIPRYIMGGWLWARGYDYEWLDPEFDHTDKWFANERKGRAPPEAMLAEVRVPMRALTAISAVLLYGVVRVMAGPIGGVAAALLFCGSSYVPLHMVRAMGEPPFITFLLASLLVCLVAIKRGAANGPGIGIGVLAGGLLGLAFASKLTTVIAIVAVVLWGVWAVVGSLIARRLHLPDSWPGSAVSRRLLWSIGVVGVAFLVFVVTNPYLYHDTINRFWLLFANRHSEMAAQAAFDPSRAVETLGESVQLVWKYSLIEDTWAHDRLRWPLEAALAVVGLAWLTLRAVRLQPGADGFLLLWVLGFWGGVTVGLGYVLDHYFMPTATMGLLLAGLAVGWSARLAWAGARRLTQRALTNSRPPFANESAST
jgi:hypothetical protein